MKHFRIFLLAVFLLLFLKLPVNAGNTIKAVGINVNVPTQSQIVQFVKNHPVYIGTNAMVIYDVTPSTKQPYKVGKVAASHLKDGLNAVNIIRYIAGIPANITLDDQYCADAQAGAVINAANNQLDHTPGKPVGMTDELYDSGYRGTSSGNLSAGYPLLSESVISGYMNDGDASNISVLGHRRWVINPPMEQTGFGYTPTKFSAMYAFDNSHGFVDDKYSVTPWPAQNMPLEYFDKSYPFSISLSEEFNDLDRSTISVKMTRLSDGKIFSFNGKTSNNVNSQTFFNVNNDGYAQPHCIIWRPDVSEYKNGEGFSIEVFGVKKDGTDYPISYTVSFFRVANSLNTDTNNYSTDKNIPHLSKLTFSISKLLPGRDVLKLSVSTDKESYLYSKVYDKNNNLVATIAKGSKLKNAGNWYVTWKGTDSSGKYLYPGTYRVDTYLSNGSGTSKVQSKNIEILSINIPTISNLQLVQADLDSDGYVLKVNFKTDKACTVYCNIYDSAGNKIAVISKGAKVANAGNWCVKWNGLDASGNQYEAGKYRVEVYLHNDFGNSNTLSQYIDLN